MKTMLLPFLACLGLLLAGQGAAEVAEEPIKPLPASLRQDPARVALGARLFHEVRLSGNQRVSCASCHDLAKGGADGRRQSLGWRGQTTALNAPTVLNAALNFKQFWDGRAATLEEQIDQVVQNPVEMGGSWPDIVRLLARDDSYRRAFDAAYKDGVTRANIQNALASYERTLITPDSRFDRYLRGDGKAITANEKAGYLRFKQYGCVACHQGANVGGNMFQKFGVMEDLLPRSARTGAAQGRFLRTGREEDRQVFKVPSLRNVAQTAPYLHDGSAATLEEAIDIMFRYQLGRVGSAEDKRLIAQFLGSLSAAPRGQP
ncbi:cytochrome-c peroxidase [Pseudoduganella violacea]|uniref:Cytochrome c peroxidase n=1 Tax=Pseudoduganella violacea TaxID=1715466 RepID=A0A7W5FUB8_9BURK|nr:cytochrome c peroxidase [Pseudoduganella violacea]MBB3119511.1 cytochrome c peroxidase [Pseudoduganella violacea]